MKRILAIATALALALPAIAVAQPDRSDRSRNPPPAQGQAGPRNFTGDRDRGDARARGPEGRGPDGRDFQGGRDRGDRHFNYQGRDHLAYRAPAFQYPRGWAYRPWYRGQYLPRFFISAPYFFDYSWLGLPPPPYGYRWVRYGPDALLVSIYTGQIRDVIYNAFY